MKPELSILLPHLRQRENDKALKVCLDTIIDNTGVNYEIIVESVAERRDIYPVCNSMAERARAEYIVFHNSDVFFAPGWAEAFLEAAAHDTIVAGVIVECGAIGVASANIKRNFGMTPESYQRAAFERWVISEGFMPPGEGWYFPSLHPRDEFVELGGFDSSRGGFMVQPSDIDYWNQWRAMGRKVVRVPSFCYHLQNFSTESEQTKAVRHE